MTKKHLPDPDFLQLFQGANKSPTIFTFFLILLDFILYHI